MIKILILLALAFGAFGEILTDVIDSSYCPYEYSVWQIPNVGRTGNFVYFGFARTLNVNMECIHEFTISSLCASFSATYSTIHSTNSCPTIGLDIIQSQTVDQSCYDPAYPRVYTAEQAIFDDFQDLTITRGYCLNLNLKGGASLIWGGYTANFLSGSQMKVWFS